MRDPDVQRDWDNAALNACWSPTPDLRFFMRRLAEAPVDVTALGASGPVLEVAAAEAAHACALSMRGLETVVLEPSPAMLVRARARMDALGARITLVRGIAEALPFRDGLFERVLCESAIDHMAQPDAAVREMIRVMQPAGRLVISFVNYGGASARLSRVLYRLRADGAWRSSASRASGAAADAARPRLWDSPVPAEHTFEATLAVVRRLCGPYLRLDRVVGVSLGWGVPGWSAMLERLGADRAERLLRRLDVVARRAPALADYVVTVWRRPSAAPRESPGSRLRVPPSDPAHRWRVDRENGRSDQQRYVRVDPDAARMERELRNAALTGRRDRSWVEELIARGPFDRAAALGWADVADVAAWVEAGASRTLDVYAPTSDAIRAIRRALRTARARAAAPIGIRFVRCDFDFLALPRDRYDVVWSGGTLSRVVNLEHVLGEVEGGLHPGGIFALGDYVGERRLQYDATRLACVNAALADVPGRFRRTGDRPVERPDPSELTPLCAVRSDEILPLAAARFAPVHRADGLFLFPLFLVVDLPAMAREAPEVLARLVEAEEAARDDGRLRPCATYAVFRRR